MWRTFVYRSTRGDDVITEHMVRAVGRIVPRRGRIPRHTHHVVGAAAQLWTIFETFERKYGRH